MNLIYELQMVKRGLWTVYILDGGCVRTHFPIEGTKKDAREEAIIWIARRMEQVQ